MILTRRIGEAVVLRDAEGREIGRVIVADIKRKSAGARLGFEFPTDIKVHRAELDEQIQSAKA